MFTQLNKYFTGEILNQFSIQMVWDSWKTFTFVASSLLVSGRDRTSVNLLLIKLKYSLTELHILYQECKYRGKKWLQRNLFQTMKFSFVGFFFLFCSGLFVGLFFCFPSNRKSNLAIERVTLVLMTIYTLATDNIVVSECLLPS